MQSDPPVGHAAANPRLEACPGVHELYRLGLSRRAIAAQAGWSERDVDAMLRIYGHADLVALAEVDALYSESGMQIGMQDARDPAC